jgi:hypothetical protein
MPGVDVQQGINQWHFLTLAQPVFGQLGNWGHAGSLHVGGCHVGLADGSVRFLGENTNRDVLRRLALMNDGEVVEVP